MKMSEHYIIAGDGKQMLSTLYTQSHIILYGTNVHSRKSDLALLSQLYSLVFFTSLTVNPSIIFFFYLTFSFCLAEGKTPGIVLCCKESEACRAHNVMP